MLKLNVGSKASDATCIDDLRTPINMDLDDKMHNVYRIQEDVSLCYIKRKRTTYNNQKVLQGPNSSDTRLSIPTDPIAMI